MIDILFTALGSSSAMAIIGFFYNRGNRITRLETKVDDLPAIIQLKFDILGIRLDRIERSLNGALVMKKD